MLVTCASFFLGTRIKHSVSERLVNRFFFFFLQFLSVVFSFILLDQPEDWLNSALLGFSLGTKNNETGRIFVCATDDKPSVLYFRVLLFGGLMYLKAKQQQKNIPLFQVVVHV